MPEFKGTRKTGNLVPFEFTVSIRPFKENRLGRLPIQLNSTPFKITNEQKYPSKPLIKLTGSGDASFFVNEEEFKLKALDKELIIDSFLEESYRVLDGKIEHQDHVTTFLDFPELKPGENTLTWTNRIKSFELTPRWRRKV